MKQLGQSDLSAHAWVFGENKRVVRLRMGASDYLLNADEAFGLATELVQAVDQLKAGAQ
jgi:hypothetical protein